MPTIEQIEQSSNVSRPTVVRFFKDPSKPRTEKAQMVASYMAIEKEESKPSWLNFFEDISQCEAVTQSHISAINNTVFNDGIDNKSRKDEIAQLLFCAWGCLAKLGYFDSLREQQKVSSIQLERSEAGFMYTIVYKGFYYTVKPYDADTSIVYNPLPFPVNTEEVAGHIQRMNNSLSFFTF